MTPENGPEFEARVDGALLCLDSYITRYGLSLQRAAEEARTMLGAYSTGPELGVAVDEAVRRYRLRMDQVETLRIPSIRDRVREEWYAGPQETDTFWPSLRAHLVAKGWEGDTIRTIDKSSTRVLASVHNPGLPEFDTRGLVVGYVQSGKTANMTAVMAKAADTNFRFFIVLSGLTDALRNQTQERIEQDLVDRNKERWYALTAPDADFAMPAGRGLPPFQGKVRYLAIVKKNAAVLRRLLLTIRNTTGGVDCPVMVIDDECDQASVNTARYRDRMTAINRLVRELLKELRRVAYVGYTATPFANVLIDPEISVDPDEPDDLYPRHFILALPRPSEYFGPERIFGRDILEADEASAENLTAMNIIRHVPDDEIALLRPARRQDKDDFSPAVTPTLARAISYFLLATAARCVRGHADHHSSMLVHTTSFVAPHFKARDSIQWHVSNLGRRIRQNDRDLIREMASIWAEEISAVPSSDLGLEPVSFDQILECLEEVADSVEVVVENGVSDERIDYPRRGDSPVRRYIVVGGNVLARGLTIEGLVVSFFLRTSSQYDTLMQMGRWFGYRIGYEDLPRVWMTDDLQAAFHDLATMEAEIRNDIDVYDKERISPLEFAVRIRQIPGMAITARNKMLAAQQCSVSYSNRHEQTFRFRHRDRGWLDSNWQAGADLVQQAVASGVSIDRGRGGRVLKGVSVGRIYEFLESYEVHETHDRVSPDHLAEYIQRQNTAGSSLASWTIGIVETRKGTESQKALGPVGKVKTSVRSRLAGAAPETDADIKALMSRSDLLIDLGGGAAGDSSWAALKKRRHEEEAEPLLLLYPIEAESEPSSRKREPLGAITDVLGVGIVFPPSERETPVNYVRVPLAEQEYEETEIPEDPEDDSAASEEPV